MSVDSGKELFRLGFLTAIEVPDRGFVGGLLVTNQFGRPLEFQCTAPLKPNRTQEILYGPTLVPYVLGDLIGRTLLEKVGVKPHLVLTERHELLGLRELVEIPVACVDDMPANGHPAPTAAETLPSANSNETSGTSELVVAGEPVVVSRLTNAESVDPNVIESSAIDSTQFAGSSLDESSRETIEGLTEQPPASAARKALNGANGLTLPLGRQLLRFHSAHANDRSVASRGARVVPNNADLREPFERVREALGETARLGGAR
ncbi:MAG TPA: hypothetical protein VFG04_05690 [Planctomycetaceae bacterium]|jgi:hypothetical protein|nr:hypothetical protein [Planctomycetaceae bacterium]